MGRTVEVDEERLLAVARLESNLSKLMGNKQARLLVEQAAKIVDPNAVTPALDAARAAHEQTNPLQQEVAALKKEVAEREEKRDAEEKLRQLQLQFDSGFDRLRREENLTSAGVEELKKIMEEKGIMDHDVAYAYFLKKHPPQELVMPNGSGAWNFMDDVDESEDLKKLIETRGENNQVVDKMARDALKEARQQRR
jgi:hypothetical protein